ncbi:hypothetical protein [Actinoplanes regularis]|uniref:hypothetical protein n=1 Tax=Actinoplanes regularis TaxID=52697 RepID=UPI002553DC00|nr:hypothetical protein [Actinoplanes regularis]
MPDVSGDIPLGDDEHIDLLRLELAEVRASDDRADRKSQILLGFTGVILGISVTTVGKWRGDKSTGTTAFALASCSVAWLGFAVLLLVLVVSPQLGGLAGKYSWNRRKPRSFRKAWQDLAPRSPGLRGLLDLPQDLYTAFISRHGTGEDVLHAITSDSSNSMKLRLAGLIYALAIRAKIKHRGIQCALAAMLAGSALLGVATVIGQ